MIRSSILVGALIRSVTILILISVSLALSANSVHKFQEGTSDAPLRLHASVQAVRYCAAPGVKDTYSACVDLELQYVNVSGRPVILNKNAHADSRVARSAQDLTSGRLERDMIGHEMLPAPVVRPETNEPQIEKGPAEDPDYIVISLGKSYKTSVEQILWVPKDPSAKPKPYGSVSPGVHFLELYVYNSPSEPETAKEKKVQWKQYGELYLGPLKSAPVKLTLQQPDSNVGACN